MSDTLRKRGREPEALPDCTDVRAPKRFDGTGEETELFRHLLLLDKTVAENEECASSEDFVIGIGVTRSLEEEMSRDNSPAYDICSVHEGQTLVSDSDIDLCYLLEASDDELGIPSSPVLDSKAEFCQSPEEIFSGEGLSETPDLKCQGENWDFEEEFQNYQQFGMLEDAWDSNQVQDYMNKDFISQDLLFEGDYSAPWTVETVGCM